MPPATITVEQTGSPIRRPAYQRRILKSLSLNRIGRIVELPDSPATRGQLVKVKHLIRVLYATCDLDAFVEEATTEYKAILVGASSRIVRGTVLWSQFESAVEIYHASVPLNRHG
ncbi:50S ribosomal protein L30 [Bradyrhizobium sp. CCBAU 51753]|nr:50S ribosomal protein L30 [Bradyrhizobium sp. CCBAU 51753]